MLVPLWRARAGSGCLDKGVFGGDAANINNKQITKYMQQSRRDRLLICQAPTIPYIYLGRGGGGVGGFRFRNLQPEPETSIPNTKFGPGDSPHGWRRFASARYRQSKP